MLKHLFKVECEYQKRLGMGAQVTSHVTLNIVTSQSRKQTASFSRAESKALTFLKHNRGQYRSAKIKSMEYQGVIDE